MLHHYTVKYLVVSIVFVNMNFVSASLVTSEQFLLSGEAIADSNNRVGCDPVDGCLPRPA